MLSRESGKTEKNSAVCQYKVQEFSELENSVSGKVQSGSIELLQ